MHFWSAECKTLNFDLKRIKSDGNYKVGGKSLRGTAGICLGHEYSLYGTSRIHFELCLLSVCYSFAHNRLCAILRDSISHSDRVAINQLLRSDWRSGKFHFAALLSIHYYCHPSFLVHTTAGSCSASYANRASSGFDSWSTFTNGKTSIRSVAVHSISVSNLLREDRRP